MPTRTLSPEDLLDINDAADILGVSREWVRRLTVAGGRVPAFLRPKCTASDRRDVFRLAERRGAVERA